MTAADFPLWLRLTHLFNILFISLMMRSGLEIFSSLPKLYWQDDCPPGKEWLRIGPKRLPTDLLWTSLDEEISFPSWLALPGGRRLGLGRHWHFITSLAWVTNGVVYVVLLFATGLWPTIVPTHWSIIPGVWHALLTYLSFHLPPAGNPYNPLQQVTYFAVIFLLAPMSIATGIGMSPAFIGRFPWYSRMLGGKQGARSVHFLCFCAFVLFVIGHTGLVALHGLGQSFALMALGSPQASPKLALAVGLGAIALVIAFHVFATIITLRWPRRVQRGVGAVIDPLQRLVSHAFVSHQNYAKAEVSPFFRVNGYPPRGDDYLALLANDFQDWRLEVSGLVEQPLSLGLHDLRAMRRQVQVTKHNCIQGWSAVAEWAGVPLRDVLAACRPLPNARYVVLYAFDDKTQTAAEGERGEGRFYGTLDLNLAHHPQTILAYEMNGLPLPVEHGAPLRLRVEVQLGFTMVKWIRALEFVESYAHIGQGQGGWREDNAWYSQTVPI